MRALFSLSWLFFSWSLTCNPWSLRNFHSYAERRVSSQGKEPSKGVCPNSHPFLNREQLFPIECTFGRTLTPPVFPSFLSHSITPSICALISASPRVAPTTAPLLVGPIGLIGHVREQKNGGRKEGRNEGRNGKGEILHAIGKGSSLFNKSSKVWGALVFSLIRLVDVKGVGAGCQGIEKGASISILRYSAIK